MIHPTAAQFVAVAGRAAGPLLLLLVVPVAIAGLGPEDTPHLQSPSDATYTNPLGDLRMGDPFVLRHGGRYYLYGTTARHGFRCWTSPDLLRWTPAGFAYHRTPDSWGRSTYWAPEVIRYGTHLYMVYSCQRSDDEGYRLCLATSDSPTGPFRDAYAPWCDLGWPCIDGHVFVDTDGTPYVFFSKVGVVGEPWREPSTGYIYGIVYGARLAPDLSGIDGEPVLCAQADQDWEDPQSMQVRCNEGAYVMEREGTYYMTYSSGSYASPRYGIGCATAPHPLGPWTKSPDNPLVSTQRGIGVSGPGHNSMALSPDGSELFMVYHAHADPERPSGDRTVNIDRVVFDEAGRMALLGPTRTPQPRPAGSPPP
jgi:GH43 family beta-xylosidase